MKRVDANRGSVMMFDEVATLSGGVWSCANPLYAEYLNAAYPMAGDPSDPDPVGSAVTAAGDDVVVSEVIEIPSKKWVSAQQVPGRIY